MIGVIIVGGLAALGIASIARRHHRWHHAWHHGGWGHHGWHHGHDRCGGWAARHHHHDTGPWGNGDDLGEGPGVGAWMGGGFGPGHAFGPHPSRLRRVPKWLLRGVFRRLEATPTQQQALRAAAEEFEESARALKGEAVRTRADVAAALRQPAIDAESMGELFARHDTTLDGLRKAFVGMTIKVHDILDGEQRERLARLIEAGPRGMGREMRGDDLEGNW